LEPCGRNGAPPRPPGSDERGVTDRQTCRTPEPRRSPCPAQLAVGPAPWQATGRTRGSRPGRGRLHHPHGRPSTTDVYPATGQARTDPPQPALSVTTQPQGRMAVSAGPFGQASHVHRGHEKRRRRCGASRCGVATLSPPGRRRQVMPPCRGRQPSLGPAWPPTPSPRPPGHSTMARTRVRVPAPPRPPRNCSPLVGRWPPSPSPAATAPVGLTLTQWTWLGSSRGEEDCPPLWECA
jgi:hypothetical protein